MIRCQRTRRCSRLHHPTTYRRLRRQVLATSRHSGKASAPSQRWHGLRSSVAWSPRSWGTVTAQLGHGLRTVPLFRPKVPSSPGGIRRPSVKASGPVSRPCYNRCEQRKLGQAKAPRSSSCSFPTAHAGQNDFWVLCRYRLASVRPW